MIMVCDDGSPSQQVGSVVGQKRSRHDLNEEGSDGGSSAYDKPYLGQHQQGIPFTHPLKRIRMPPSLHPYVKQYLVLSGPHHTYHLLASSLTQS